MTMSSLRLLIISLTLILNSCFVFAEAIPSMGVALSPDTISFHADTSPGIYDSQPVDIIVTSEHKDWSISCEVGMPLTLQGTKNRIPIERLFVNSPYFEKDIDQGAGPGYENLVQPRLVSRGSFTAPIAMKAGTLKFRLLTTWDDKPGTYIGNIKFTYLAKP